VDADGLPDTWEMLHFGNLNTSAATVNLNGQTALQNYVAGTTPGNSNNVFKLTSSLSGSNRVVSFPATEAQGVGYEGKQRYYSLESSPSPTGPWVTVGAMANILGAGQTVTHQTTNQPAPAFYRGRVWLQTP
jgi:hypothetical protein